MLKPNRRQLHARDDSGQTMTEYSLVIGLIAAVVALALPFVGSAVARLYVGANAFFGG
jgi:Flp pilus assembly pilin Flp